MDQSSSNTNDMMDKLFLFQISFVAIRGSNVYKSIAIDDVSLLDDVCTLQPVLSYPLAGERRVTSLYHLFMEHEQCNT